MSAAPEALAGRIALVTGASSGIGTATAAMLAARGCRVICAGRDPGRLAAAAAPLGAQGHALTLDIADEASVASLLERLPEAWREIDILVNSAAHAVGGRPRFDKGGLAEALAILNTNVAGVIRLCHVVAQGMIARGHGHIVNVGSISGTDVYANDAAYITSKAAIVGFTRALRADFAGTGIKVSEVRPGLTRTGFAATREQDPAKAQAYYARFPNILEAEDVARSIVFTLDQPPAVQIAELVIVPRR